MIIHKVATEIEVIELLTLRNCLPVSSDTYLRILHGLSVSGYIKLPGKSQVPQNNKVKN